MIFACVCISYVFKMPLFREQKKLCFDCFLHCLEESCSLCFLLSIFCVSLHVVSPLATRNKGHGMKMTTMLAIKGKNRDHSGFDMSEWS